MNHVEVRRHLAEGMNIERNSPVCRAMRAHLEDCRDCREYLVSLDQTIGCYKSYAIHVPERARLLLEETLKNLSKE
ncbi:MAG: hypothetical protein ABI778_04095 [Ignavibacteriota bacterium]